MHQRLGRTWARTSWAGAVAAVAVLAAATTWGPGRPAVADAGDGAITVRVVRDVNANGVLDPAIESGVAGIPVSVSDDSGVRLEGETDAAGVVTFDPSIDTPTLTGGRYRVEATIPPSMSYLQPAQVTAAGPQTFSPLTTVVDVSGGADAALLMGVINPADHTGPSPQLVTAFQWPDSAANVNPDPRSLISFSSAARGIAPEPDTVAAQVDTGTVYGLAYQGRTESIFSGAFAKRITAYGPAGPGGIYRTVGGVTTLWGVVPDAGDTPHGATTVEEYAFWDVVGKESLGDVELSEDGRRLFVANLHDRQLYEYDATLEQMGDPLSATPIPDPGCADPGDWRPFGLGARDQVLYVGGVCSGESSGLRSDVFAAVWTAPLGGPAITFGATPVLEQRLDFLRGDVYSGGTVPDVRTHWNAWLPSYDVTTPGLFGQAAAGAVLYLMRPMPMLTDIAVENDGSLVLGFRDRLGDQLGLNEPSPRGAGALDLAIVGGDLNRACRDPDGTYSWEGSGTCPKNTAPNAPVVEFYPGEHFGTTHLETAQGAIALSPSQPRMAVTTMDPGTRITSGGVGYYDRTNGSMWTGNSANAFELYADRRYVGGATDYSFGKGNGLADLEIIAALAPVEIGDYVWFDADRDGLQDPGETPIEGVTVQLLDADGTVVGTTTTDAGGHYYFGGSFDVGMLNGAQLQPNTAYVVRIPDAIGAGQQAPLTGFVPTVHDAPAATDTTDSDGVVVASHDQIAITTGDPGFNNHTYDFGFHVPLYDLALRKTLAVGQAATVNPGALVTFTITVFNQGTEAVTNATVIDHLPDGTTLEDADWTAGNGNTASTVVAGPLAPGASAAVDISLRLAAEAFEGSKANVAEISSFRDEWDGEREDIDSTPDELLGNETRVDDEIDNGGDDEDDEDVAEVNVVNPPPTSTTTTTTATTAPDLPPTDSTTTPPTGSDPSTTVVTPVPPTAPPPPTTFIQTPGNLPATGGGTNALNLLAAALLLAGTAVRLAARVHRRSNR